MKPIQLHLIVESTLRTETALVKGILLPLR